jgi:iron(III) transport system substrate-binding protein
MTKAHLQKYGSCVKRSVIPAKPATGASRNPGSRVLDSRFRGNDRKRFAAIAVAGLIFAVEILSSVCAFAQTANLLEQAKKEGEVVLYSTMPVTLFDVFQKAAKEKYPFLNFQHVYLSSSRQVARVMLEHRSGKIQADVLGNSLEGMFYYKEQKVLGKYDSPEAKAMIDGSVDPEHLWFGMTTDFLISAFNTRMLPRGKAPKSYDDYLNAEFKGQMAMNIGVPYALTGMASLRGEEQARIYLKKLEQQNLRPVEGFTHMTNLLAAGEYPMAIFMQVSKIEDMKKKGGPVDWLPAAPTFATLSAVGMVQGPLHPAAARLLVDFFLSSEGQQALVRAGKIPLRRGVKSPAKSVDELLAGGNIHVIKPEGDYSDSMKLYRQLLGMKS